MSEWTDLLLAFYQRVASSLFHNLNAIFVTDSLGPLALLCFFPQPNKAFLLLPQDSSLSFCSFHIQRVSPPLCSFSHHKRLPFFSRSSHASQNHFPGITYQSAQRWAGSPLSVRQHQVGSSPGRYMSRCHQTAASRGWWRRHTAQGSRPRPRGPWNAHSWVWRDPRGSRIPREEKWQKVLYNAWARQLRWWE